MLIQLDIPGIYEKILSYFCFPGKCQGFYQMIAKYIFHHHKAGRPHYDLRLIQGNNVRSWSLRREPPLRSGICRLAIEMEIMSSEDIDKSVVVEEPFGAGRVYVWDAGDVEVSAVTPGHLRLSFLGKKLSGNYELRLMRWYPGNRWLFRMEDRA